MYKKISIKNNVLYFIVNFKLKPFKKLLTNNRKDGSYENNKNTTLIGNRVQPQRFFNHVTGVNNLQIN
jgi:hypothetical protein